MPFATRECLVPARLSDFPGSRAASYGAEVSRLQRRLSNGIPLDATFPLGPSVASRPQPPQSPWREPSTSIRGGRLCHAVRIAGHNLVLSSPAPGRPHRSEAHRRAPMASQGACCGLPAPQLASGSGPHQSSHASACLDALLFDEHGRLPQARAGAGARRQGRRSTAWRARRWSAHRCRKGAAQPFRRARPWLAWTPACESASLVAWARERGCRLS